MPTTANSAVKSCGLSKKALKALVRARDARKETERRAAHQASMADRPRRRTDWFCERAAQGEDRRPIGTRMVQITIKSRIWAYWIFMLAKSALVFPGRTLFERLIPQQDFPGYVVGRRLLLLALDLPMKASSRHLLAAKIDEARKALGRWERNFLGTGTADSELGIWGFFMNLFNRYQQAEPTWLQDNEQGAQDHNATHGDPPAQASGQANPEPSVASTPTGPTVASQPPQAAPRQSAPEAEAVDAPWEEQRNGVIVSGWHDILKAIGVGVSDNGRRSIKAHIKRSGGPIYNVGRIAQADKGALLAWWNDVEARARAAELRGMSKAALENPHHQVDQTCHSEKRPNARGKARPA